MKGCIWFEHFSDTMITPEATMQLNIGILTQIPEPMKKLGTNAPKDSVPIQEEYFHSTPPPNKSKPSLFSFLERSSM